MISLATETERTLFFDFLPLDLGSVRGFKTRIHLYTVPGQVFYDASRKLILRGVDGIVFVADSQQERMDANVEALDNLMANLKEHGYDFNKIPYVLQLNKRDLPNILPVDALTKELRRKNEPVIEAVAFQGPGVFETLKEIARQVLHRTEAGRLAFTPSHSEERSDEPSACPPCPNPAGFARMNSSRPATLVRPGRALRRHRPVR